jgi:hypothetical protein
VLKAEKDGSFPGQPKRVIDALTCPRRNTSYLQLKKVLKSIARVVLQLYLINVYLTGWMRLFKKVLLYR